MRWIFLVCALMRFWMATTGDRRGSSSSPSVVASAPADDDGSASLAGASLRGTDGTDSRPSAPRAPSDEVTASGTAARCFAAEPARAVSAASVGGMRMYASSSASRASSPSRGDRPRGFANVSERRRWCTRTAGRSSQARQRRWTCWREVWGRELRAGARDPGSATADAAHAWEMYKGALQSSTIRTSRERIE